MNNFELNELNGRTLLENFLNQIGATDQRETTDKYDPVDYYYTFKGKTVVGEIKCRDAQYENFPTHMMEMKKFQALIKDKQDKQLDAAYYINFFGNDTVYFYSETTIRKYATQERFYCNRTTAINTGKTLKPVLLIPTGKAIIYKCNEDGIWYRYYKEEQLKQAA